MKSENDIIKKAKRELAFASNCKISGIFFIGKNADGNFQFELPSGDIILKDSEGYNVY